MDDDFSRQSLLLHSIPNLTQRHLRTLLLHYGGPEAVCCSDTRDWRALGVPSPARASARLALQRNGHPRPRFDPQQALRQLCTSKARILAISDGEYPALLRAIHDPPPLIYTRGNIHVLAQAQVAVVGSRRPTPAGERAAAELTSGLAQQGLVITSGLAIGIDGIAHRAALDKQCATVAVLACGIDQVYPARHRPMAEDILAGGCLLTEFAPGTAAMRENFPRRNRIVTGLSIGTLVVEAALPSGSLISAYSALEQGREVFTLPWSIYHRGGAGCLKLLREGAHMVLELNDILSELGPLQDWQQEQSGLAPTAGATLAGELEQLLHLVGYEVVQAGELVQLAGLPVARVMAGLSALELHGLVARCEGGYVRC